MSTPTTTSAAVSVLWELGGWIRPCDSDSCIEVHVGVSDVTIRNSQRPEQAIACDLNEWAAFLGAAKEGHFD